MDYNMVSFNSKFEVTCKRGILDASTSELIPKYVNFHYIRHFAFSYLCQSCHPECIGNYILLSASWVPIHPSWSILHSTSWVHWKLYTSLDETTGYASRWFILAQLKKAKYRVRQSQGCCLHTTHVGALKLIQVIWHLYSSFSIPAASKHGKSQNSLQLSAQIQLF